MANFGDPGFHVHSTMGQFLTLLAFHLADDKILPIDVPNYGVELRAYYDDLLDVITESGKELDTSALDDAIKVFQTRAKEVKALEENAVLTGDANLISVVNHKYRDFQRGFVSQGGLPTREFYRHVVTAPGLDTGYAAVTYPGITEAVEGGNFSIAEDWVGRTAKGILRAAEIIKT
jgi:N-acetylated-alpha-linked acidic dipeptidase